MAKVIQNIAIDEHNYLWLLEEKAGRRQKNISVTINELLKNYQYMVKAAERVQKENDLKEKRAQEAEEFAAAYRKQAVSK